jgi:4-hydroxy-2-oxoglutarate aldolase
VAPLVAGTTGEAVHLSHSERVELIRAARKVLDRAGDVNMPVIAGTGAGSTHETIGLCKEAAQAGADYAIVIASGYFAGSFVGNKKTLKAFWSDVASQSHIPIIIYNCA